MISNQQRDSSTHALPDTRKYLLQQIHSELDKTRVNESHSQVFNRERNSEFGSLKEGEN